MVGKKFWSAFFCALLFSAQAWASVCTIFVHGYTRTADDYFGKLPHQVKWDSSLPILKAAPQVAQGILKEIASCEKDSPVILRTHSYGAAQVYYILSQGKRFQELYPNHSFVQIYKRTVATYAYTGAFHGTPIMDLLCSSKVVMDIGDWASKPCVLSLMSSPQLDVSHYVTSPGVPFYLLYSTDDDAWLGIPGKIIGHFGQSFFEYEIRNHKTQNDNTLPTYASLGCSSTSPLIHPEDNCLKLDSNFFFDIYHESKLGHLDFRKNKKYMTKTQANFLNHSDYSQKIQNTEVLKKQQNYPYNFIPVNAQAMGDPVARHDNYPAQWISIDKDNGFTARLSSEQIYFSDEDEALFWVEFAGKTSPQTVSLNTEIKKQNELVHSEDHLSSGRNTTYFKVALNTLEEGEYIVQTNVKVGKLITPVMRTFILNRSAPSVATIKEDQLTNDLDIALTTSITAKKDGLYLIEMTLKDLRGLPLATIEKLVKLQAGEQEVKLFVDGLYFYENRLSGPFTMNEMAVSEVLPSLEIKRAKTINIKYTTQAYHWAELRKVPNKDPVMAQKLFMLYKNPDAVE